MPSPDPPHRRRGAYALSDLTAPVVVVTCPRCSRTGRYSRDRLLARHGDIALPDLLRVLSADCPERIARGSCGAVYAGLVG